MAESAPVDVSIPGDRRMVGLEATWEIDALSNMFSALGDELVANDVDLISVRLQLRGVAARIRSLNCITMSILGEDDDASTRELAIRVFGVRGAREVQHG